MQTALFDATSGRDAGATVDVITKGGSNDFHGSVFEYFRNEDLNANEWFAKRQGQVRVPSCGRISMVLLWAAP